VVVRSGSIRRSVVVPRRAALGGDGLSAHGLAGFAVIDDRDYLGLELPAP